MMASTIIFYLIAAFILIMALLAVTGRKIFRAAIWLLFSLIGVAALYFWMNAAFIAAVQIIVYVGGIVVLIIFSIFLTQQSGSKMPVAGVSRRVFAAMLAVIGFALSSYCIYRYGFSEAQDNGFTVQVEEIGFQLLNVSTNGYALPFEVVSILLLAAMIGCIVIASKTKTPRNE